jgi:hypothetical protein
MPGISTMAPCSFDDAGESPNHLVDLGICGGSTEGKSNTFARLLGRQAEPEQHRRRLNRSARTRRAGRDRDALEVERHDDRLAARAAPRRVDGATDPRPIVAVNARTDRTQASL